MKGQTVVRVIEFEGDLMSVAQHMARQDEVRGARSRARSLPRAAPCMVTPQGAATFFANASMRCVISRKAEA